MWKTDSSTVSKMHESSDLVLLVLHQSLVRYRVDTTHVGVGVFVRIKDS